MQPPRLESPLRAESMEPDARIGGQEATIWIRRTGPLVAALVLTIVSCVAVWAFIVTLGTPVIVLLGSLAGFASAVLITHETVANSYFRATSDAIEVSATPRGRPRRKFALFDIESVALVPSAPGIALKLRKGVPPVALIVVSRRSYPNVASVVRDLAKHLGIESPVPRS